MGLLNEKRSAVSANLTTKILGYTKLHRVLNQPRGAGDDERYACNSSFLQNAMQY